MITNGSENLCIAGVYGGQDSGVKQDTTAVFIESAYFNPVSVRKTAKEHGLNTDASFRFERGVDPNMTRTTLTHAVKMIAEITGGSSGISDQSISPVFWVIGLLYGTVISTTGSSSFFFDKYFWN